MSKRSNFVRKERDLYMTPEAAVYPLIPHLPTEEFYFWEPCAGDGRLFRHIEKLSKGLVLSPIDIEPLDSSIKKADALTSDCPPLCDYIITNPPWDRKILHPMITHFSSTTPTWLLFDADWAHTQQAKPYLLYCEKIVSVGRVKWFEDSKMTGKDNCAWYLFGPENDKDIQFYGRI